MEPKRDAVEEVIPRWTLQQERGLSKPYRTVKLNVPLSKAAPVCTTRRGRFLFYHYTN